MFDQGCMNVFSACSAHSLAESCNTMRLKKDQERKEYIEDTIEANKHSSIPMVKELKALVEELQEQNRILKSRIDEVKREGEEAKKVARKSITFSWISFGVATVISIVALIVSII